MTVKSGTNRILAALLACVLIACLLIPVIAIPKKYGSFNGFMQKVRSNDADYPCVLVHGFGGWGENSPQGDLPYFGVTTGNLADYLRGEGYTVCVPTVGPYSSTWDRTCELYAQLTGTQVDYGAAHAAAHHHARYGRTYDEPMVPDWGQKVNGKTGKIDLVSHSFGGPTIRMLASLLAYGDKAEKKATGKDTSPLFTGGKADWVQSITTLCSPNNGSVLTCIVDDIGNVAGVNDTTGLLVSRIYKMLQLFERENSVPDLMLDQFGIGTSGKSLDDIISTVKNLERVGNDHAVYDLSPDGAAELNKKIRVVNNVYYFSYAFSTTKPGKLLRGQVPVKDTFVLLSPLALAIGTYTGKSAGGIVIDESWQENDGLVSIVSAQYPTGAPHAVIPEGEKNLRPGVFYVMPTVEGDHASAVGGLAGVTETHALFNEILARCKSLNK